MLFAYSDHIIRRCLCRQKHQKELRMLYELSIAYVGYLINLFLL